MPSLEYLVEHEVLPVLKDIADSLKKIANPARVVLGYSPGETNPHPVCAECGALLEGASYDHDPSCSQFPVKP